MKTSYVPDTCSSHPCWFLGKRRRRKQFLWPGIRIKWLNIPWKTQFLLNNTNKINKVIKFSVLRFEKVYDTTDLGQNIYGTSRNAMLIATPNTIQLYSMIKSFNPSLHPYNRKWITSHQGKGSQNIAFFIQTKSVN